MSKWQDMSTAPKDRRIIVDRPDRSVGISIWDDQKYYKRPRPFWSDERSYFGVVRDRESVPTRWMEIPESEHD